jgi:hypothetical protein
VAVFCSTADAALPGRTYVAAKTRMETQNSVITPNPSRLKNVFHSGCERDDQPALVVVDALHLEAELLPLRIVNGGDRVGVELVVGGVVEVRLVERGRRQRRERDLRQVEVVVPVVLREDPLQVAGAVEVVDGHVADVDVHACCRSLLG